jgi:hypothetical protein
MRIGRSLRGARAAVFAVACVGLSAAGHVWMSGDCVPLWAVTVAILAVGGAGYALAGRQRGFVPIAALMLAGELALHLLFTAAQHVSGSRTASMPDIPGLPALPAMIVSHAVPASAWLCGAGMSGMGASTSQGSASAMALMSGHGSAGMIAVHGAAGLICSWWLRCGEAATFRLLRSLAVLAAPLFVLVWPCAVAVPDFTLRTSAARGAETAPTRLLLVHALVRRGPPPRLCMC